MTPPKHWLEADTHLAVEMWNDGATFGEISKAIQFRHTRNGVKGKIHRMGLAREHPDEHKSKSYRQRLNHPETIREKFLKGAVPSDISAVLNIPTRIVREKLRAMGFDDTANTPEHYRVHPCWSMSDDDKRQFFYEKFSEGWKEVMERLNA